MKTFLSAVLIGTSLIGVLATACSESKETPATAGTDGGGSSSTKKDASSEASTEDEGDGAPKTCSTAMNGAMEATASTVAKAAPAATGGTIADGTYYLTEFNLYDPTGDASPAAPSGMRTTLVIAGNKMESVQEIGGETMTFAETFTVDGTALKRILMCPTEEPDLEAVYSVTGTSLTIYESDPDSKLVAGSVYIKR